MKKIFIILMSLMFVACAAPRQPLNTPSGKAEYLFKNIPKKQLTDAIVASALSKGSTIKSVTDYSVVLAKRIDNNTMVQLLYGSRYDVVPEARTTLSLVDVPGGVLVYARGEIVTNPGSAYERVEPVNADAELQRSLEDVARRLDR